MNVNSRNLSAERIKLGSYQTEYVKVGHGAKHILFFHGLNNDWTLWRFVLPLLSAEKYTCWALTLPVYGQYRLTEYGRMVEQFIQKNKLSEFYFVGQSMGGLVGLQLISQGIIPQKMILVSTPLVDKPERLATSTVEHLRRFLYKYRRVHDLSTRLVRRGTAIIRKVDLEASIENYLEGVSDILEHRLPFDPRRLRVKVPFLLVYGKVDVLLKAVKGKALYTRIGAVEIVRLNTGHFIPETRPKNLAEIIERFF